VLIDSVPINTLNRQCSSGLTAIAQVCPSTLSSITSFYWLHSSEMLCVSPLAMQLAPLTSYPLHPSTPLFTLITPCCPRPRNYILATLGCCSPSSHPRSARMFADNRSPTRSKPVKSISESQPVLNT
jgi:hypothetical protein